MTSEKDALQLVNQELNNKLIKLQKVQEYVMAHLSETLVSKKIETEMLVSKLEEKIDTLSEKFKII